MVESLSVLISNAVKRCKYKVIQDESFSKGFWLIYPFTTENIDGYIDLFDLEGRSLLTVGSSGDQIINARLKGCRDITVMDVNPYTKFFYYLKVAAIVALTREEFLLFFRYKDYPRVFKDNKYVFNKDMFERIKNALLVVDYESYLLWDEIFMLFKPERIRKCLFSMDENRTYVIEGCNSYLASDEAYDEVRDKILRTDIKFITGDLFKMDFDRQFDNVWLSNIACYLKYREIQEMVDKMYDVTSDNGKMLLSYLYQTDRDSRYVEGECVIYNLPYVFKLLSKYDISLESFIGVDGLKFKEDTKDSILLLRK